MKNVQIHWNQMGSVFWPPTPDCVIWVLHDIEYIFINNDDVEEGRE